MEFMLKLPLNRSDPKISHKDKILLIGSCFTEEIGNILSELKFPVLQNPHGILFDPLSISRALLAYTNQKRYLERDLTGYNGKWLSWDHHSHFSRVNINTALSEINGMITHGVDYIQTASWLVITLGSSYAYELKDRNIFVANCHKAPGSWFEKKLVPVEDSFTSLHTAIAKIRELNRAMNVIITVSPVRHVKDGVTENNRSKARLIEVAHRLCEANSNVTYFPAYEIVIDVLRDYRFYNEDMVHPTEVAVKYVFEKFGEVYFEASTYKLNTEIDKLLQAKNHRPFDMDSTAYREFLEANLVKVKRLKEQYPDMDLKEEMDYFSS